MEIGKGKEKEVELKELLFLFYRKLWILIIVGLLGAVGVCTYSIYLMDPEYTSTAKVYVISRQEDDKTTINDIQTGTQLTKDYMVIAKSRSITEVVINQLNLDLTHEQLIKHYKVSSPYDTRILEITATYNDPQIAKRLADAIAAVSAERMVSVMEMKKANVFEKGNLPKEPSGPNVILNTILGGLGGIILSSGVILLRYMMNDSIKSAEDIEKYLGLTTLSAIPYEEGSYKNRRKIRKNIKKTVLAS